MQGEQQDTFLLGPNLHLFQTEPVEVYSEGPCLHKIAQIPEKNF